MSVEAQWKLTSAHTLFPSVAHDAALADEESTCLSHASSSASTASVAQILSRLLAPKLPPPQLDKDLAGDFLLQIVSTEAVFCFSMCVFVLCCDEGTVPPQPLRGDPDAPAAVTDTPTPNMLQACVKSLDMTHVARYNVQQCGRLAGHAQLVTDPIRHVPSVTSYVTARVH